MKNLKIALVEVTTPSTHVYSRTYLPRVGIPTMGTILDKMGYKCDIYLKPIGVSEIESLKQYDIVGIGSLSCTISEAYRIADILKANNQTIIMGGPHVTFMPEEAIEHCNYVVTGEGDHTLPALVESLENNNSQEEIPGLYYRKTDGNIHSTGKPDPVDYQSLPSPDFSLSKDKDFNKNPPIIVTSRGCPFNCSFCSVTKLFGRKYRFRTNEQIISELAPILDRSVCFGDDNFCANPDRTKKLLREMIDKNSVPLRWSGQMCVSAADDFELLELMQKTRCRIVYVGIESVNPETLNKYGKGHKVDAVKQCVKNLHDHNIGIHGMFVIDKDDNLETANNIVDYAIDNDIDTIQVLSLAPFPGTESFERYKNDLLHKNWNYYDGMHVVTRSSTCTPHQRQMSIIKAFKRFYSLKRILFSYKKNMSWRVKYRFGGYLLIRKWEKENSHYLELLKNNSNSF